MSNKRFIVTVDPDADPESVAVNLTTQGFKVDNIMREIGVISASTDADDLSSVRKVQGVSAVEEDRDFQLPTPDSPVQ